MRKLLESLHYIQINLYNIGHLMQPFPKLKKLLTEKVILAVNFPDLQLGKKMLDTLFYKICCIRMNDEKIYKLLENKFGQIIIQAIQISNVSYLLMCFGAIIKNSQYQKLKDIQDQIQRCIKAKAYQNTSSIILNKSINSLPETSFSGYKMELNPAGPAQSKKSEDKKSEVTSIKQQSNEQSLDEDDRKILQDLQRMCIPGLNNSFNQDSAFSSGSMIQMPKNVEQYLKTKVKSYNNELNLVIQIFKFETPKKWNQSNQNDKKIQQYHIIIPSYLTMGKGNIKISGRGEAYNKKTAKQQASLNILRTLYERFPNILEQIVKIKSERALW